MDVCVGVESAADSARKPPEQTKKSTKQYVPPVPRDYQLLMIAELTAELTVTAG